MLKKVPHTYTIVFSIIIICAVLTWIIPGGEYARETVDVNGIERTVIKSDSFHEVTKTPQTWEIFSALFNGFEKQAGIIAFILIIGGAFWIMNNSRAIDVGIFSFLHFTASLEHYSFLKKIGINNIIMTMIMLLFSSFGAIFGMSEETLAFIVIIIPLAISMGYDSITGLCLVYVAAHVGFAGAILNPFTIGIAQGLSDLPLFSGFEYRLLCWVILNIVLIAFVLRYAAKVKACPASSIVYEIDTNYWRRTEIKNDEKIEYSSTKSGWFVYFFILTSLIIFSFNYPTSTLSIGEHTSLTTCIVPILTILFAISGFFGIRKSYHFLILTILGFTIIFLIIGVMGYGWYLPEISGLFLAMGIFSGFAAGKSADSIVKLFIEGVKDILSAALIVGLAGGIIIILQEGHIIDPILHALATLMSEVGKVAAVGIMYIIQTFINIIIPSGSAKAALTMPIMAPFSDVIGLSRQATVMAFQFGDGFTNMITPTSGVLIGALGIARIPYDKWITFFWKFLILLILMGFILLIPTATIPLNGF
ncbi:YfcC family protein [Gabonibacter massiliensis]|uniref:YfcC family protein n=1 Tax=Gabonibacter massiliensis TaxID=1720195 RepID=UPI00073F83F8|nr:AbgT family transporter [Gabonibacter massiliensis]